MTKMDAGPYWGHSNIPNVHGFAVTTNSDAADKLVELQARIERMEAMMVLLCEHAAAGQGSLGKPFWAFIDDWRREHAERA